MKEMLDIVFNLYSIENFMWLYIYVLHRPKFIFVIMTDCLLPLLFLICNYKMH